jgi:Protein of unknown function (DUF2946)
MMAERHRNSGDVRRLAVLLGVFALLLRCVIAPGVMPDPAAAAHGAFKLIICTGGGMQEHSGLPDDGPAGSSHPGDTALCPYAATGHLATAPGAGLPASVVLRPVYAAVAAPRMACSVPLHIPGARAPPSLA